MPNCKKVEGFSCALLVFACVIAAAPLHAQLSTASLNGVVRDSTGAVVPGTSLELRNADTGIVRTGSTNDSGTYVFENINPGPYTLKITAQSFATREISRFVLAVNQTATIDVTLTPGAQTEIVSVEAQEQLQVSSAELGTVIATKEVNDLPLNGRNFTQLLSLTPGVVPISVGQSSMGGRPGGFATPIAEGSDFSFPAINGATNRSNYFLTDGLSNFAAFLSAYAVPPIIDAIQEFKVVSHADSSQYGSVLGGIVNVVTKSGTSQFHGVAWDYLRNNAFDSNDQFAKINSYHQNQFGATFGGPVPLPRLKNNTFFFFAYQGFRYSKPVSSPILVPTAAMYAGDFSSYCTAGFTNGICNDPTHQIYNPFTTVASGGSYSRTPYLNNQIPMGNAPGDVQPQLVSFMQSVLPSAGPLNPALNSNAFDSDPNTQHQNEYNVRVDHTFGSRDSAWFRYSRINSDLVQPGNIPRLDQAQSIPGRNYGANWVHTFNPTLDLQVLFSRTTVQDLSLTKMKGVNVTSLAQAAGFAPGLYCNFSGISGCLLPGLNLGDGYVSTGGENFNYTTKGTDNNQFSATLNMLRGTHTFTVGGGFITNKFASPIGFDTLTFDNSQTNNGNGAGGFSIASALIGVPNGANRRDVDEATRPGGLLNGFFQDSWKMTPKLTVNYGVRYDLTLIPAYGTRGTINKQGGIETGDFDFSTGDYVLQYPPPPCTVRGQAPCIPSIMPDPNNPGNVIACNPATQSCLPPGTLPPHVVVDPRGRISHNTYDNIGPHAGFAYRATENTVVRGGAGIVYDNWAAVSQMSQNIEGDWPGIGQLIANNLNVPGGSTAPNGIPTATYGDPFAAGGVTAGLPAPTPFTSSGVNWHYDPHIKDAYAYQFNFGIERQINSTTTIQGAYVGSLTHRADVGGMYNTAITPGPGNPQTRALYPYMIATFYDRSVGFADYHAFQLSLNKRYTKGLAYQVAYTFSKALDENDGWFGAEGKNVSDPYNPRASLSPAGYDIPQQLTVNFNYDLPVGVGKQYATGNHAVDYLVGNWQLNGIFTIRSGQRYSVEDLSGDPANTGNAGWAGYEQANLVGDPNAGSCPNGAHVHSVNCWFNTGAFAAPAFGTFGNLRPDAFQAQRYWNMDFSIFRDFPLWGEQHKLQFRAESYNLFNTTIFGAPHADVSNTSNFGLVTSRAYGNAPRVLQFALKFYY